MLTKSIYQNANIILTILFICLASEYGGAQERRSETKKPATGVGLNMNKVELLYKDVQVTSSTSSGRVSSYPLSIPRIRINGGEPKDLDPIEMLSLFKNCPPAKKEVNLYMVNKKKANSSFLGGLLIGGGLGMAGLLTASYLELEGKKGSGAAFGTGFGLGLGTFIVGFSKSRKYNKKTVGSLNNSVEKYNLLCYNPPLDTILQVKTDTLGIEKVQKVASEKPKNGITDHFKENVGYKMLRNDPKALRFYNFGITPLGVEAANNRGFNMLLIADMTIQLGAKVSFSADYKKAYVDNLTRNSNKNTGGEFPAVDYKSASRSSALVSLEIKGKNRVKKHEAYLGSEKMQGLFVENRGTFDAIERISYGLRSGFSYENAVYYSENGLPIATSNTTVTYQDDRSAKNPVPIENMDTAMPMVRSGCLAIGFGRKKIVDYKIELLNSTRFKGKRNSFGFSEFYCDFLYGLLVKSGDVAYRYQRTAGSLDYNFTAPLSTDLTQFDKLGFRAGYNVVSNGLTTGIEVGARPGISTNRGYFALNFFYRLGNRF